MEDGHAFPPIRDYALIGDCRTAALIAPDGSMEWLCFPDFDSPSIFATILDRRKGGCLNVSLRHARSHRRRYLHGTNILESHIESAQGTIRLVDFMPVDIQGVATLEPEREVLRIIEAVEGNPEIRVLFSPAPQYGKRRIRIRKCGRIGWTVELPGTLYLLRSDIDLIPSGDGIITGKARLEAGKRRYLSFSCVTREPAAIPTLGGEADRKLEQSHEWWKRWSSQFTYEGEFCGPVLRSALTLKALQSCLSGAVLAAPTTSLPEAMGAERNWDYRYCWLRDAAFTLRALIDTGFRSEAAAFFDWLMHSTRITQPKLKPLYDIYGRTRLSERTLDYLTGYRNSRPVRVGNGAHNQLQLDIYGMVISAATIYLERGNDFDRSERRLLRHLGETVCRVWDQPDNGIWEFRGKRQHHVWSKVMCWSALNDLLKLHEDGIVSVPHNRFHGTRVRIARAIFRNGFDAARGTFVGAFGEGHLDATAFLLPWTGIIEARDPRMISTWNRLSDELEQDGLMLRYNWGTDQFSGEEGAFLACSFWAVEYLARASKLDEAKDRMRMLLGHANDVGLYSEELEPGSGAMLGNFPQAFSHSSLINAALSISEKERDGK